jgi:predicted secreted protein
MPPLRLLRSFLALWWVVGIGLLALSVRTVALAFERGQVLDPHMALIGGVEAAAAILFLVPRTLRAGAAGLLLTIAIAWLAHAHGQLVRWDLAIDAAAVLFVAVHGPLTGDQWRQAFGGKVKAA